MNKSFISTLFSLLILSISVSAWATPPSDSGARVLRSEDYNWWMFDAKGMAVFVGIDIPAFCSDAWVVGSWQYQVIVNPSDIDLLMAVAKGDDLITNIYPATAFYDEDGNADPARLCEYDYFYGPIASGTSDAIYTDNDGMAYFNDHSRANAFGVSAHGVLFTPEDEPVNFSGSFHCVYKIKQNPDKAPQKCSSNLSLGE